MFTHLPDAFSVVFVNTLVVVVSELILYAWVYRTSAFKSVKVCGLPLRCSILALVHLPARLY